MKSDLRPENGENRRYTEGLSSMEDERYIESLLLLSVFEAEERDEVVYERLHCIFRSDQVKSYQHKINSSSSQRY